jgi:anti-sigma regulatory factor (Ser/Thr protein kinase)
MAHLLGVSPSYVRQLANKGTLPSRRTKGGHRVFDPEATKAAFSQRGAAPTIRLEIPLNGLEEDVIWQQLQVQAPISSANQEVGKIARYAFTELLNNAIDHSGGTRVLISWRPGSETIKATIEDDGVGAFERIRSTFGLPDHLAALQQLSKGKLTTQADRHSGEGIFFTSKAVDLFELSANHLRWIIDNRRDDFALGETERALGTEVSFEIDAQTTRRLEDVFAEFSDDEFRFSRSQGIVRLFEHGSEFVSRSEAKRLLAGLEKFADVDIDFTGVETVGQGFADEVFRVWANAHPEVRLRPTNMNPPVALMVNRAVAARSSGD